MRDVGRQRVNHRIHVVERGNWNPRRGKRITKSRKRVVDVGGQERGAAEGALGRQTGAARGAQEDY